MLLEEADGTEDAAHIHGEGDGTTSRERRIAVEEFGDGAHAVVEEFFFKSDELSLDIVHSAHLVDTQISLKIEAGEPGPCGALVVGIVALLLMSCIVGGVAATLGRERTDALGRFEFARADIEHAFALFEGER